MPLTTLDPVPALVVIDLQKGVLGAPAVHPVEGVVANAAALADAFRAADLPVVLVTVDGVAPGRTDAAASAAASGTAARTFPPDFAELVEELGPRETDHLVTKRTWGAFTGTSLQSSLRSRGATQVVLAGIATGAGVESTARFAHELGFHVVLVLDAMTDRSATRHERAVSEVFPAIGETTTTAEVLAALGARAPGA